MRGTIRRSVVALAATLTMLGAGVTAAAPASAGIIEKCNGVASVYFSGDYVVMQASAACEVSKRIISHQGHYFRNGQYTTPVEYKQCSNTSSCSSTAKVYWRWGAEWCVVSQGQYDPKTYLDPFGSYYAKRCVRS
ncbi:MAG TPA: hypothetical protein VF062_01510 [Candidatus Limnocylindrales bacterium]